MTWKHSDDDPGNVTRRAEALRELIALADAHAPDLRPQETEATVATAEVLGLPWEAVDAVFRVFEKESGRLARERREKRKGNDT